MIINLLQKSALFHSQLCLATQFSDSFPLLLSLTVKWSPMTQAEILALSMIDPPICYTDVLFRTCFLQGQQKIYIFVLDTSKYGIFAKSSLCSSAANLNFCLKYNHASSSLLSRLLSFVKHLPENNKILKFSSPKHFRRMTMNTS